MNNVENKEIIEALEEQSNVQEEILHLLKNNQIEDGEDGSMSINLKDLLFSFLRWWWTFLLSGAICGILMFAYCNVHYVPVYRATAKMYVNNNSVTIGSSQVSITSGDLTASQALVDTYCEILKTYLVLDQVGKDLEKQGYVGYSYENLIDKISCASVNGTEIFYIAVKDTDPERAIDIVNTIVADLPDQIATVIEGSSARTVDLAKSAFLQDNGFAKKITIATFIGMLTAALFVFLFDFVLNDKVKNNEWLETMYPNVPILGEVPDTCATSKKHYGYYHSNEKKQVK